MVFIFTVDHLKRLTREIATVKYDMRQTLTLLDILVKRTNTEPEAKNTEISFEGAEDRFPLQTAEQLMEVEEILKHRDSQHNAAIVSLMHINLYRYLIKCKDVIIIRNLLYYFIS